MLVLFLGSDYMNMREYLSEFMDEAIFYDGFDEAILGHGERCGLSVVLYDANKCIEILMRDGMTDEEAIEFFEYNVLGGYIGPSTPIICYFGED